MATLDACLLVQHPLKDPYPNSINKPCPSPNDVSPGLGTLLNEPVTLTLSLTLRCLVQIKQLHFPNPNPDPDTQRRQWFACQTPLLFQQAPRVGS